MLPELSLLWGLGLIPLLRGAGAALLGMCFPGSVQEWLSVNSSAVVLAQPAAGYCSRPVWEQGVAVLKGEKCGVHAKTT